MRHALLFAAAIAATPAQGQVLTLEEARQRALASQPALNAIGLGARAAEESAVAEGALPDPRLKFGALNFPRRNFPAAREDMTQLGVSLEQAFPGGDKRRLRTERAQAESEQIRAEAGGLRQGILRDVGTAWVELWQAYAARRLVEELVREYERAVELARIASAAGRGPQSDLLAARQAFGQATDRRLELDAQAQRARSALARWVPEAGARPLPDDLPELPPPASLDAMRAALEHHPQHAAHVRGQGVAEADVALAREASKPDRSVEIGYYARNADRPDMLMFQVAFELPVYAAQKQDRSLQAKLALLERSREQRADHLRQLHADLDAAYADWRVAGERLRNLNAAVLPDANARLAAIGAQHGAGAAPLGAVFEARRGVLEARLQELALRSTRAKARIALQYFEHGEGGQ
jgi:outer membrane protein TolC